MFCFPRKKNKTLKRHKALLVGINYRDTSGELYGCINDAMNMKKLLSKNEYTDFMIITEDEELKPTRENIIKGLKWLVEDSHMYHTLFFHYSGHGSWLRDLTDDEADNRDECLVPLDYTKAGMILDDLINDILIKPLKTNLIGVVDACHSGSMFDLKYEYTVKNNIVKPIIHTQTKYHLENENKNIVMISGCRDSQTSADAWLDGQAQGALSFCLFKAFTTGISMHDLLKTINNKLIKLNMTQRPVISSNKPLKMENPFKIAY